jgi:hypothetical protein
MSGSIKYEGKQQQFIEAALSGAYRYILYGGAVRGGKTYALLGCLILLCKIYPKSRWAVVRKDLPTLVRNTVPSFNQVVPGNFLRDFNRSRWVATFVNGSELFFFPESAESDPDYTRWRGLEVNGFGFEEADEMREAAFEMAIQRAGAWQHAEGDPDPLILLTCNPAPGWVKKTFYDPWKKGSLKAPYLYIPAKITDNVHAGKKYIENIETLREKNPKFYRRFVEGDWETGGAPNQLCPAEWVLQATEREGRKGEMYLGVDVARFGDDVTCLCWVSGYTVTRIEYYDGLRTTEVAELVKAAMREGPIDADHVRVDVVGLGAGVADALVAEGYHVVEVQSGGKAPETDAGAEGTAFCFKNLRSYLWWQLRDLLREGDLAIGVQDSRLLEDVTAPRYSIGGDRMVVVESKDAIKKRIGRSTDAGDALVYALYDPPEGIEIGGVVG